MGRCAAGAKEWDLLNGDLFEYTRSLLEAAGDGRADRNTERVVNFRFLL